MTDEIVMLQSRIDAMQIHCAAVEADNARLRGLIEDVEWAVDSDHGPPFLCPFCWNENPDRNQNAPHARDCEAFTITGDVR